MLTIKFPTAPDVPARAQLYVAPPPAWNEKLVADLARRAGIDGKAQDMGPWLVVRDGAASLEIYQASHSLRYEIQRGDGERLDKAAIDEAKGRSIADDWVSAFGPTGARFEVHSITEAEVLVSRRPESDPERYVAALQVNYRFSLGELPLIGAGAKMQVCVNADGEVTDAYRFWREAKASSAVRVLPAEQAFERFSRAPMFSDLIDDSARAEVTQARLGYFALPPTEPQSVLLPVYEFRGVLSTELHPHHEFIAHVPATAVKPVDLKNAGRAGSPVG
jgi:hypothetical protein